MQTDFWRTSGLPFLTPRLLFIRAIALRFRASYVCICHELGQVRGQQPVAMTGRDWHPPGISTTRSGIKTASTRVSGRHVLRSAHQVKFNPYDLRVSGASSHASRTVLFCSRGGSAVYVVLPWENRTRPVKLMRGLATRTGLGQARRLMWR